MRNSVRGTSPVPETSGSLLDTLKSHGKPVARLAATSALYWVGSKMWSRITGKKSEPNGAASMVQRAALEAVTEVVMEKFIFREEEPQEDSAFGGLLKRRLGRFTAQNHYFTEWQSRVTAAMLLRFFGDKETGAVVRKVYGPDCEGDAQMMTVVTGRDETVSAWGSATIECSYKGEPVVVKFNAGWRKIFDEEGFLSVYGKSSLGTAGSFIGAFREYVSENNYLRGAAIDSNGNLIDVESCDSWDEVVLPEEQKRRIRKHTVDFLKNADHLAKMGVRTSNRP